MAFTCLSAAELGVLPALESVEVSATGVYVLSPGKFSTFWT